MPAFHRVDPANIDETRIADVGGFSSKSELLATVKRVLASVCHSIQCIQFYVDPAAPTGSLRCYITFTASSFAQTSIKILHRSTYQHSLGSQLIPSPQPGYTLPPNLPSTPRISSYPLIITDTSGSILDQFWIEGPPNAYGADMETDAAVRYNGGHAVVNLHGFIDRRELEFVLRTRILVRFPIVCVQLWRARSSQALHAYITFTNRNQANWAATQLHGRRAYHQWNVQCIPAFPSSPARQLLCQIYARPPTDAERLASTGSSTTVSMYGASDDGADDDHVSLYRSNRSPSPFNPINPKQNHAPISRYLAPIRSPLYSSVIGRSPVTSPTSQLFPPMWSSSSTGQKRPITPSPNRIKPTTPKLVFAANAVIIPFYATLLPPTSARSTSPFIDTSSSHSPYIADSTPNVIVSGPSPIEYPQGEPWPRRERPALVSTTSDYSKRGTIDDITHYRPASSPPRLFKPSAQWTSDYDLMKPRIRIETTMYAHRPVVEDDSEEEDDSEIESPIQERTIRRDVHVSRDGDERWALSEGDTEVRSSFKSKMAVDAMQEGRGKGHDIESNIRGLSLAGRIRRS